MEACGSAHHWGRELQKRGHKVVLLPPHHVRPACAGRPTFTDVKGILEAYRNVETHPAPVKLASSLDTGVQIPVVQRRNLLCCHGLLDVRTDGVESVRYVPGRVVSDLPGCSFGVASTTIIEGQ